MDDSFALYFPVVQSSHEKAEEEFVCFPVGHLIQPFPASLYLPGSQSKHSSPFASTSCPAVHESHLSRSGIENSPDGHALHSVVPVLSVYVPERHAWHSEAPELLLSTRKDRAQKNVRNIIRYTTLSWVASFLLHLHLPTVQFSQTKSLVFMLSSETSEILPGGHS